MSLNEGLDVPVAAGTIRSVFVGGRTGHMDELCIARVVALFRVSPPFCVLWSYGEALSRVIAGRVCPAPSDRLQG